MPNRLPILTQADADDIGGTLRNLAAILAQHARGGPLTPETLWAGADDLYTIAGQIDGHDGTPIARWPGEPAPMPAFPPRRPHMPRGRLGRLPMTDANGDVVYWRITREPGKDKRNGWALVTHDGNTKVADTWAEMLDRIDATAAGYGFTHSAT